ncbi:D-hydantoinase [Rubripirellula lacrimiformis]|uniref:D-hydantoinase n=1 Tax=Rubripirellula lacrimiformis TaxID=1930273 RepID=A0A517N8D0_9BACT|nr:dihydropyrimidinase [Rubripirellula lacrimiformis]QDT03391.1 D-hydantoinase [Rubripirellula lacrimiformis]
MTPSTDSLARADQSQQSLLIRGGRIITADQDYVADILVRGERIVEIATSIPQDGVDEVIDASGKLVFPGFIDPHVHIHLPFMGTHAKDDYDSASRAALIGGTTTLIEMICPGRDDDPWEAYQRWKGKAEGLSACDFSFHMGVTRFDAGSETQLRRIIDDGITSLKVFLAYKGALGVTDTELFRTCQLAADTGAVVTAHCENADLIDELQSQLVAQGKVGPEFHEPSRPVSVEADGVHHFCTFLEMTGASGYIVHTSCSPAIEAARQFQARGVDVTIETVIPYLVLDKTYAERPNFEGAKYVMSPPLRDIRHQTQLWNAIGCGTIATVATDHAPFDFADQKAMGRAPESDFTKIPNGIPSVEHRCTLLYTHGVATGKIDLHQFVSLLSTNAAKQFGMFPAKGTIGLGSDADIVVWDPNYRGVISAETHTMNTDYDGFEGFEIVGRPSVVTCRGQVSVRDGKFTGKLGHGRAVPRKLARKS